MVSPCESSMVDHHACLYATHWLSHNTSRNGWLVVIQAVFAISALGEQARLSTLVVVSMYTILLLLQIGCLLH